MSKHTPGPWFADSKGSVWRRDPKELYENGGGVAFDRPIARASVGWSGEGESGYPLQANARLIAAAPDLLEALEKLEEYADGFSVSCVYLNEETEGKRLLMKARAAIAKAKGEQQ